MKKQIFSALYLAAGLSLLLMTVLTAALFELNSSQLLLHVGRLHADRNFRRVDDCGCLQIRVDGRGYGHNRKVLLYLQQMKI